MAINPLGTNGLSGSLAAPQQGTNALGKDDFMKLLIAQMSNQDPLSPVDNSEFVAQLAQFSSLESMNSVRDAVDSLSLLQSAATNAQVASLVGREVTVQGEDFSLHQDQPVDLGYQLASAAEKVEVTIYDQDGHKVRTMSLGPQESGAGTFSFDGHDDDGNPLPAGDYSFKIAAFSADDVSVASVTKISGRVSGISFENGYPELLINGQRYPLAAVTEVSE